MLKILRRIGYELGVLVVLSLTPFFWIGNGYVLLGHDSGFRPVIDHHMRFLWNNWYWTLNTGTDWSLFKGFLIIQAPEYLMQSFIGSLENAQLLILIFWFFVMALGMYVFLYVLFPQKKYLFLRLYGSVFWVFNFYILQGWMIAERAKFSLYAALPVSLLLFYATFQKKLSIIQGAILFGLLYFFFNGGGSPPLFGASMVVWTICGVYLTVWSIRKEGVKSMFRSIGIALSFVLSFIGFNAYWILVQLDLYKNTYVTQVSSEGGIEGLLAWERMISKNASIPNLLRLQGFPDWSTEMLHGYATPFLTHPLLIIASFIPLLFILLGVVFYIKGNKRSGHPLIPLLVILLGIGLFFASGSHEPTGFFYIQMMKYIPGFAMFRSSFYKFSPVVWLSVIVLSGYVMQRLLWRLRTRIQSIAAAVIIGGIVAYHYPYFFTSIFDINQQFTTRVKIPAYVKNTAAFLDTQTLEKGRVLVLPKLDAGFINEPIDTYNWGFYSLDILPGLVSKRMFVANDDHHEVVEGLYTALYENNTERINVLAKKLGITHVLYRRDVAFSTDTSQAILALTPEALQIRFGTPVYVNGLWEVYEFPHEMPKIAVTQAFLPILGRTIHESALLKKDQPPLVRFSEFDEERSQLNGFAVEAECMFCAPNEYEVYKQSLFLPTVRFSPGSMLYVITTGRKLSDSSRVFSSPQMIDQELSSLLYLVASLKKLMQIESEDKVNTDIITKIVQKIDVIEQQIETLNDRDQILYTNRLSAYFSFLLRELEMLSLPSMIEQKNFIKMKSDTLAKAVWVSDREMYRFIVEVPTAGVYTVEGTSPIPSIIDNKVVEETIFLTQGLHLVEIPKNIRSSENNIPRVFLTMKGSLKNVESVSFETEQLSDTEQAVYIESPPQTFLITHPTSFDTRWRLEVTKGTTTSISQHIVDGYANGWVVTSNEGPLQLRIFYKPHRVFLQALSVTIVVFVTSMCLLFWGLRKKRIRI